MSDELGRLLLYLAAPADKLLTDLGAADQHIIRYHSKWEKKFSNLLVSGIASNLNVEMVAAEAVLGRSLRNMQQQVTNRKLKLSIDTSEFNADDLLAKIAKVSGSVISVRADLSELHDLNELLDVKQAHIQETQRVFTSTVIKPAVDLGGVQQLGVELDAVMGKLDQLRGSQSMLRGLGNGGGETHQKITINHQHLSAEISKAIEQGFKSAQPSRLGKIANAATSPFQAIARGALEGFGKDMTTGLTSGLIGSLEIAASGSIGSTNLIGQKIGDKLAHGIAGKLGKSLKTEIETQLREVLGSVNVDREHGAQVAQRSKSQSRKTEQSAEALNKQRQEAVRESLSLSEQKSAITNQSRGLGNVARPVERAIGYQENKLFDAQSSGDQKAAARAQAVLVRARSYLSNLQVQQSELEVKKIEIEQQIGIVAKRTADLDKRIEAVLPSVSDSYQKLVTAAAGKKVAAGKVPQIIAAPNILKETGSIASYSARANAILVSPQLAAQYRSDNVGDKGIEASIHELTHAADFDFGSLAGVRANKLGKPIRGRQYTAAEVAYAAPFVDQYAPKDQAAELSAYAAEYSIAHPLIQKNKEARNLKNLSSEVGYGGTKYQKIFESKFAGVKSGLGTLQQANADPRMVDHLVNEASGLKDSQREITQSVQLATGAGRLSNSVIVRQKIGAQLQSIEKLQADIKMAAAITVAEQKRGSGTAPDPWSEEQPIRHVDAQIVRPNKATTIKSQVRTARRRLSEIGKTAGDIAQPIISFGRDAYNFAEGAENQILPLLPFGQQIKSIGKNVALPALAYGATASIPGVGPAIHGTLGAGAQGLLSLAGGAAQTGLTHAITGAFADLPMIGPAISSAMSTAAGGAIEAGMSAMVPILAGKTLMGAGQQAARKLTGSKGGEHQQQTAKILGQNVAGKSIAAAQSLVTTEISPLETAQLPAGGIDRIIAASKRISGAWNTIQTHIDRGNTEKARFIAQGLERQTTSLIAEAKAIEVEVGKNTPAGNKLFSLQGNLGQKRKQAQKALKKIELIDDDNSDLDSEVADLRQKKLPSRRKQFQQFKKSYTSQEVASSLNTHTGNNYAAQAIPDPWENPRQRNRVTGAGRYQQAFQARLKEIEGNDPISANAFSSVHRFTLPPVRQTQQNIAGFVLPPVPSSHNPKVAEQPSTSVKPQAIGVNQARTAAFLAENLAVKVGNFDMVAQAHEATIRNRETLNKISSGDSLKPGAENANKLKDSLLGLAGAGKYAIGAFAGFQIGQLLVTQFAGAAKEAVQLTSEFEQLEIRLQAATGSLQAGSSRFNALRSEARTLGVSQRGALETGARLSATTYGTELEGAPTDQITSQVLGIAKSRGLNQQSTNSLSLAISQLIGKPRVSTEEINQLIESGGLPDARAIGARAMGSNAQQFTKQLEGTTGIDSKKFVSSFLAQASSDSLLVNDAALDTQQSKLAKLQSSYEDLQLTIGGGINPAFKAGLDVVSGGLDLLNKGIEIGSKLLTGFAVVAITQATGKLLTIAPALLSAAASFAAMEFSSVGALKALKGLAGLAFELAALYAIGEGIKFLADSFKDAGEDLDKETNKIQASIDALHGTQVTIDLPKTAAEIGGKDWGESFFLGVQRTTTPLIEGLFKGVGLGGVKAIDTKIQQQQESRDARTKAIEQLPVVRREAESAVSAAAQISKLDLQAQRVTSRRSALFLSNPNDATGIRQLDTESKRLAQERFQFQKNISRQAGIPSP